VFEKTDDADNRKRESESRRSPLEKAEKRGGDTQTFV
jgi:hypothetical protein